MEKPPSRLTGVLVKRGSNSHCCTPNAVKDIFIPSPFYLVIPILRNSDDSRGAVLGRHGQGESSGSHGLRAAKIMN